VNDTHRKLLSLAVAAVVLLGAGAGLAVLLEAAQRAPVGPVDVLWDRDICAHCNMHVGEPGFAAQLHNEVGDVFHFDDPGCLFEFVAQTQPRVAGTWFHHGHQSRWLTAEEAVFVRVEHSPMGFGLAAVGAGEAAPGGEGGFGLEEARARVLGRTGEH
jgi:hypothetical protein